jgi:ABC-2 type transport system ATP-binding protein
MNNDHSAIAARGLTKRFGDFTAVDNIDFRVRRGEIFGFLGPNGAGKTTTIRMMLGLLPPTAGTVHVLGMPVSRHAEALRPRVGYMAQRFSLYNDLTVLQNLRFYGRAYGLENTVLKERIRAALRRTGLEGREHVHTRDLSGGWRQRLALNAAILHRPELVFLDEPTAGVDPISRRAFWDLLYELVTQGITVFVTTHYMDEAEHCHRLAFIQRGKLIACGSPEEIKRHVMSGVVLEIASDNTAKAVKVLRSAGEEGRLPLDDVTMFGAVVHVTGSELEQHRGAIAAELRQANIAVGDISVVEPSLEDVFIECMR